ncbi:MAG: endonuclease/exonuclease/phosphatase family protein [Pseudomonadota bacterium]
MTISFLSWNVENFHNDRARVSRVISKIAEYRPDVFALYEVKGAAVFQSVVQLLPEYHFFITESPGVPEIMVGVKNAFSSFVTQRDELQSKVPTLRPGALATLTVDQTQYAFLFLHLKSFPGPRDWGLRDDMFAHVTSLKRSIDRAMPDGEKANFIAIGDINTMGLKTPYNNEVDFDGETELRYVDARMSHDRNGLRRLTKTHTSSWWNGKAKPGKSALDHAYASNHLIFKPQTSSNGVDSEVRVAGWVDEPTEAAQRKWIEDYSDHCLLYGEVHLQDTQ